VLVCLLSGWARTSSPETAARSPSAGAVVVSHVTYERGSRRIDTTLFRASGLHRKLPLIVYAPGYGQTPGLEEEAPLLRRWAAAGYEVAGVLFPFTRTDAPGGSNLADYINQPADVSFVITQLVTGPLSGGIDPSRIGVAGHSLGAVTVLGLVGNTCCRDRRIKAAVAMSTEPLGFQGGSVDYRGAPPLLLIHGDADQMAPYPVSVEAFNQAFPPKGLLTIRHGNHASTVDIHGPVATTTIVFFDHYLAGRHTAVHGASLHFRSAGPNVTLPTPTTPARSLHATVAPATGLVDGQTVTVTWDGFESGIVVNVVECARSQSTGSAENCDLQSGRLLQPDPGGFGSLPLRVHTGAVGTAGGTCEPGLPTCLVVVNQGGSTDPSASVLIPISFK
jgi:acetyl esterase/lipase